MTCQNGHETPNGSAFCSICGIALASGSGASVAQTGSYSPTPPPVAPAPTSSLVPTGGYVPAQAVTPTPVSYTTTTVVTATPTATRGMYTAAAVINWVVLGLIIVSTFGLGIIAAAWFVPMTVMMHKGAKGPYKHTALGVCTLLFCGLISGILILVDDSGRPPKPAV